MGVLARAAVKLSIGGWGTYDQGVGFLGRHAEDLIHALSASNVSVTHRRALQVPAYATAVRVISEDVGRTPLISYQRTANGKERAVDHPSYAVLHDSPNPYMTAMVFKETLQSHVLGWGNCYGSMLTDGQGIVTAIWPVTPDRVEPKLDPGRGLFYRVTLPDGETRDVARADMFHLPGLGFDGITGYPVLTAMMRESLGAAIAQQEYVGKFYANDARPGVYLKHPGKLSDESAKRLRATWDESHAGLTNAHRTALLEEGMSIDTIGVSPLEQQLLDSRKWSATEIAGQFRLAPWKVGVYDRATWANVEDGNIDHLSSALEAWFTRWDQQVNLQVYGVGSQVFAEHLRTAWLRGNSAARSAFYTAMRNVGAMSSDEIRDAENLNRRGGAADDLFAPLNFAPINTIPPAPPATPPGPGGTA
jgi:HK97 family phage portal protein